MQLLSFSAYSSCYIAPEKQGEFNINHQDKVIVKTQLVDSNYYVLISAPKSLDDLELNSVHLVFDDLDKPTFIAMLDKVLKGNEYSSLYEIDVSLIRDHFIAISYGHDCGYSLLKTVVWE